MICVGAQKRLTDLVAHNSSQQITQQRHPSKAVAKLY